MSRVRMRPRSMASFAMAYEVRTQKRLRSAREIEAQCRQETIRTQTNHRTISITRFQTDHGEVRMSHSVCILRRACIPLFTVLAGLLLSGCGVNNILTYDESAKAKWSDVQNQYQRRADLIPNLVRSEERRVGKECRCRWRRYDHNI